MSGLLQIGASGLSAAQTAMEVTADNIANALTPFYSRREAIFQEAYYNSDAQGVYIADVRRLTDALATNNTYQCASNAASSSTYLEKSSFLESIVNGGGNNIGLQLNELFSSLQTANSNAASVSLRNAYLTQLNTLVTYFSSATTELTTEQSNVNSALNSDVGQVNQLTAQLAQINSQIVTLSIEQQAPLLDEREQLLTELSGYVDIFINNKGNGVTDVMLSNGVSLVSGNQSYTMSLSPSQTMANQYDVYVTSASVAMDVTAQIVGGSIAGLLAYQTGALDQAQRAIAQLELVINQQVNTQNTLGMDLNRNLGGPVFITSNTNAAMGERSFAYTTNTGSASLAVSITTATNITTSDYSLVFSSPTAYQLTRLSDSTVVATGVLGALPATIAADGFTITVPNTATFVAGDGFTISPTNLSAAALNMSIMDSSLIALAYPVAVSASPGNGGAGQIALTSMVSTSTTDFSVPQSLNPPILVQFVSPVIYQLVNANDGVTVLEGNLPYNPAVGVNLFPTPGGYDPGYRVFLSGVVDSGDQFNIAYNTNGLGDNRNGLALAGIMQSGSVNNSTLNYTQAYRQLDNTVSLQVNSARTTFETDKVLKNQADARKDQISGVSLEEESLSLSQLQQVYQANAQLLEAAQKMFDILLISISGR